MPTISKSYTRATVNLSNLFCSRQLFYGDELGIRLSFSRGGSLHIDSSPTTFMRINLITMPVNSFLSVKLF